MLSAEQTTKFFFLFNTWLGEHVDWEKRHELEEGAEGLAEAIQNEGLDQTEISNKIGDLLRNWTPDKVREFSRGNTEVDWSARPSISNALKVALEKLLADLSL